MSADDTDEREVSITATFTSTSGTVTVREMLFGGEPAVLIRPEMDEHEIRFIIESVDLDRDALVELLELLARSLRDAGDPETVEDEQ